jgi:hypothetical protein
LILYPVDASFDAQVEMVPSLLVDAFRRIADELTLPGFLEDGGNRLQPSQPTL